MKLYSKYMQKIITSIIVTLTFVHVTLAQELPTRTFDIGRGRSITVTGEPGPKADLKLSKLKYTKPNLFNEVGKSECFYDNVKLKEMLTCVPNQLVSDDGEFVILYSLIRPTTKTDSISISKIFPGSIRSLNGMHLGQLKHQISIAYDAEAGKHWKDYVTYYPRAESKAKFNADTAITHKIRLDSSFVFRGKYPNMATLLLQKKDLGFACMTLFYTDRAKANFKRYWQAMEGMLRYEDY